MAVHGCAASSVKCLVFFFNFLAFAAGLALVIVGIVTRTAPAVVDAMKHEQFATLSSFCYVTIALGCVIALFGFLGCCGAIMENRLLLIMFISLMSLILVIQGALAIYAMAQNGNFKGWISQQLEFSAEAAKTKEAVCNTWKDSENTFICCGAHGKQIDPSACSLPACTKEQTDGGGCIEKLYDATGSLGLIIGVVAAGVAILELAAVIFACCLCKSIKEGRFFYH